MELNITSLEVLPGLENISDSMELDSGQDVVTLKGEINGNPLFAAIRVCGDVRVIFKDDIYKHASSMPDELLKAFQNGKAYKDERINITSNNWFELVVVVTSSETKEKEHYEDLIDIDFSEEKNKDPERWFAEDVLAVIQECFDEETYKKHETSN